MVDQILRRKMKLGEDWRREDKEESQAGVVA